MRIPAAGADQKYAIFGALDYASGHLLHTVSARKDETATKRRRNGDETATKRPS
jgi:hypothetical protein